MVATFPSRTNFFPPVQFWVIMCHAFQIYSVIDLLYSSGSSPRITAWTQFRDHSKIREFCYIPISNLATFSVWPTYLIHGKLVFFTNAILQLSSTFLSTHPGIITVYLYSTYARSLTALKKWYWNGICWENKDSAVENKLISRYGCLNQHCIVYLCWRHQLGNRVCGKLRFLVLEYFLR